MPDDKQQFSMIHKGSINCDAHSLMMREGIVSRPAVIQGLSDRIARSTCPLSIETPDPNRSGVGLISDIAPEVGGSTSVGG